MASGRTAWTLPPSHHFDDHLDRGVPIASYRPVANEADPAPIERLAYAAQASIGFPRIDADGQMRFYTLGPSRSFERSRLGFEQPAADGWPIVPTVVLLPLLAFDRTGTRLGQGGGHYDRALAAVRQDNAAQGWTTLAIGIAWSVQEMADLPREAWDIPLDIVVTEREWIVTS